MTRSAQRLCAISVAVACSLLLGIASAHAAPVNDDLLGAESLGPGYDLNGGGANATATKEPQEPDHAGNVGGHSVWFSWTAPKQMGVTVTTCSEDLDTLLAVYTGSSYPLAEVVSNDDEQDNCELRSSVSFAATAGTTYKIAVDGKDGDTGSFGLTLRRTPQNDDLADAEPFSSSLPWWHDGNELATKEPGEPDHAGNAGGHSVWFRWEAPSSGRFSFDTGLYDGLGGCTSQIDTLLAVYTGDSYPLTEVAADDDGSPCGHGASRVLIDAVAGTTYKIAVDGKDGESGSLELRVRGQPPNDALADATPLPSISFVTASEFNEFATKEPGEPDHAGGPGGHSLWYSWVAPADGNVAVNTCGSGVDTLLAVYTGSSYPLAEVASDDDGDCGGGASKLLFSAVAGTAYKIAVDAKGAEEGTYAIALRTRPANDDLAAPEPLSLPLVGDSTMKFFSNLMATEEIAEPGHAGGPGGHSVWISWTAPTSRPVSISTGEYTSGDCYGGIDTLLAVYTGSSYPLTEVAGDDDSGGCGAGASKVVFDALAGTTYKIAVDGKGGEEGDFVLALNRQPSYDAFASARDLALAAPVSNDLATEEPGEPDHAGNQGGHSLWYFFAPAAPDRYEIDTCNSNLDTLLAVYSGDSFPLAEIGSDDDGCGLQSRILLATKPGATYKIAIDGKDGATGRVNPSLRFAAEELETFLESGPSGPTKDRQPEFEFHSNFLGTDFRCQVDAQPFVPCSGSYAPGSPLAPGPHVFRVKAVIEGAGEEDPSPATRSFVVAAPPLRAAAASAAEAVAGDVPPPRLTTTLTRKPKALVLIRGKARRVRFEFAASAPGATFLCKLDRGAYAPCVSPARFAVGLGKHEFSVLAVGWADSPESSRAHYAFRVQRRK